METYIVRVYRRNKEDPHNIIGLVEVVGDEEKRAFHNTDELVSIITGQERECNKKDIKEMRRVSRLKLRLPVKVDGVDIMGKRFKEETTIEDISSSGAYLYMENRVKTDTRLHMVLDPECSCLDMRGKVVRFAKDGRGTGVGVVFQ
jgi:hypothetical protein